MRTTRLGIAAGLLSLLGFCLPALAGDGPFRPLEMTSEAARLPPTGVRASAQRPFSFDARLFAEVVRGMAAERPDEVGTPSTLLELPHPDGGVARFRVIESPVMAPELTRKFPETRTFRGVGLDDPSASVRFDVGPRGFYAQVLSVEGAWYVEPWAPGVTDIVASFYRRDALRAPENVFHCEVSEKQRQDELPSSRSDRGDVGTMPVPLISVGATLKTYRLALATTGEYSVAVCGVSPTISCVHNALVTAVNRVTGIYERELAIRMILVANNDILIWLNGTTDPYTNSSGSTMLGENQAQVDYWIGSANYDIGHVFSTGGGGVASLGVVCWTGMKARGVTGSPSPTGDAFWVDYVAHEMGHQFGANHTFNGTSLSCGGGNRVASKAYEPGSGSTIMAYAGICASENLQLHSDPYFHGASFDEIVTYTSDTRVDHGGYCPTSSSGNNSPPTVEAGAAFTIPSGTPFSMTGSATDPDGDALTFAWEEFDLGPSTSGPPLLDNGSSPIFRSFNPTSTPTRTFPKLADILSGTTTYGETLPTTTRTMTFRLTARDDWAVGGVNSDTTSVTSIGTAGPFGITSPASAVTWTAGSTQAVTWNVAGTTAAPITCANVSITLSTDGGNSFPTTLLASTPNDGVESVIVPNTPTSAARVKAACVGNIFFAISRPDFSIVAAPSPFVTSISPNSGSTLGGTPVTITGTGFMAGATVMIGGVSAAVDTVVTTSITATTGPHAMGTVDVVVTNPDMQSGTLTNGYSYVPPPPGSALQFYTVTPCRVLDTRNPDGPLAGPALQPHASRTFNVVASSCGIPAGAKAISVSLTVTQGTAAGNLRIYPGDGSPATSAINYGAGKTRANNAIVALAGDGSGTIGVFANSNGTVQFILDVNGYFQ